MSQQVDPVKDRTRKGLEALADENYGSALYEFSNATATERNGIGVVCQDCPYQDIWYADRTKRDKCKHDLVHPHTVEYVDPAEVKKSVRMDGEVVVRHDEQSELITDGGTQCCHNCGHEGEPDSVDYYGREADACELCGCIQ